MCPLACNGEDSRKACFSLKQEAIPQVSVPHLAAPHQQQFFRRRHNDHCSRYRAASVLCGVLLLLHPVCRRPSVRVSLASQEATL